MENEIKNFHIEKNYRNNDALRASFNRLAEKTFGLNFENWYQNGFWQDNYIPYSVVIDGEVVSNVSVNACNMNYKGKTVKLIQLGTIMTDIDHRGKGYAGALMKEVIKDYDGKNTFKNISSVSAESIDSGERVYVKAAAVGGLGDYQYAVYYKRTTQSKWTTVSSWTDKNDFDRAAKILDTNDQNAQLYMVGNPGLYMFYLSQFMTENLFYIEECSSYAVAEMEDDTLILHTIIGNGAVDEVIRAFGSQVKKAVLCFTPKDTDGFEKSELHEEDTTFFVQGKFFEENHNEEYMMQAITHA